MPLIEARRISSPSTIETTLISASHSFSARSPIISNTGWISLGELNDTQHLGGRRLLLQRLGEIARARLHLVEQPHVLDRDHRLVGEGGHQLDLPGGERLHRRVCQGQDPDQHAVPHQGNAQHGPVSAEAVSLGKIVLRIGQNVRNVDDPAFERGTANERVATRRQGILLEEILVFARETAAGRETITSLPRAEKSGLVDAAQPRRRRKQRLQDRAQIECRAANDLEHVGGGGLLLARLGELARARRELLFELGRRPARSAGARSRLRSARTKLATVRSALRAFARQGHLVGTSIDPWAPGPRS